jgi:hypothetical protein
VTVTFSRSLIKHARSLSTSLTDRSHSILPCIPDSTR